MKKIMLIGSGGSGKSTLARALGQITGLPVYHLDALHWKPGWIPTPNDEWDDLQEKLIKNEKWIIDGNYGRTLDIRMSEADTIIFFDLSRWVTTYRIIKRKIQYHGRTRPDLEEGCPERLSWEFIKWVWTFKEKKRPGIYDKLTKHSKDKRIIILKRRSDVERLIERLKNGVVIEGNFRVGNSIL